MDMQLENSFTHLHVEQISPPTAHSESALSILPLGNSKKTLPELTENGSASKVSALSQRHVSSVDVEAERITRFVDLAKAIVRDSSPELLDRIDNDSWINMAQALAFSGIDTLEKAREMDLRPCPPCPLIHTWAALHGTTIFNGVNNPSHLAGLNYVERIRQEGNTLENWGIPVIVVYSREGLDGNQIDSMRAEFVDCSNVLCLEFESDLKLEMPPSFKGYGNSPVNVIFSDCLRLLLSQNIEHMLKTAAQLAGMQGKKGMVSRIETLGFQSMFYSDIDNHWMRKPPCLLASRGMFTLPVLSKELTFLNLSDDKLSCLKGADRTLMEKHQSYFVEMPYYRKAKGDWNGEAADRTYEYIVSGEAKKNYLYLYQKVHHKPYEDNDRSSIDNLWSGDNGCIYLSSNNADLFFQTAKANTVSINLHMNPALKTDLSKYQPIVWDKHFREIHTLMGGQLFPCYCYGHDKTW